MKDREFLLTPDQIKAVLSVPMNPGQPGGTKDSPDCTEKDVTRAQMQHSGRWERPCRLSPPAHPST